MAIFFEYKTNGANSFNCSERKLKIFPDSHLRARRTIKKIDFGAPFRSSCGPIRIKPFCLDLPAERKLDLFSFSEEQIELSSTSSNFSWADSDLEMSVRHFSGRPKSGKRRTLGNHVINIFGESEFWHVLKVLFGCFDIKLYVRN